MFSFGPNKPPFCIACALAASGVRSNATRGPSLSRREMKRREKAAAKALKDVRARREADAAPAMNIDWSVDEDVAS